MNILNYIFVEYFTLCSTFNAVQKKIDVIGRIKNASCMSFYMCALTQKKTSYRDILLEGPDSNGKVSTFNRF